MLMLSLSVVFRFPPQSYRLAPTSLSPINHRLINRPRSIDRDPYSLTTPYARNLLALIPLPLPFLLLPSSSLPSPPFSVSQDSFPRAPPIPSPPPLPPQLDLPTHRSKATVQNVHHSLLSLLSYLPASLSQSLPPSSSPHARCVDSHGTAQHCREFPASSIFLFPLLHKPIELSGQNRGLAIRSIQAINWSAGRSVGIEPS